MRLIDKRRLESSIYILEHKQQYQKEIIEAAEIVLKLFECEEVLEELNCNDIKELKEKIKELK